MTVYLALLKSNVFDSVKDSLYHQQKLYTRGGIDIMLLALSALFVVVLAGCACAALIRFKCYICGKDLTISNDKGHMTTCTKCGQKYRFNRSRVEKV